MVSIFFWSAGWSVLIFGGLKWVGMLRIDRDTEFRGNDTVKHGEAAYPVDAWVKGGEPMLSRRGWVKMCMAVARQKNIHFLYC